MHLNKAQYLFFYKRIFQPLLSKMKIRPLIQPENCSLILIN